MKMLGEPSLKSSKLILASASPRRRELIQTLNWPVQFLDIDVDESYSSTLTPAETVELLSLRKAETAQMRLAAEHESGIVIGSDTVVVSQDEILGKPENEDHAKTMLHQLQGTAHKVYTGITCIDIASNQQLSAHQCTEVHMKRLSDKQIAAYVATGEPMDKAGSYGIQGLGAVLIEQIKGCYFNVVGLPLSLLYEMLQHFDVDPLSN